MSLNHHLLLLLLFPSVGIPHLSSCLFFSRAHLVLTPLTRFLSCLLYYYLFYLHGPHSPELNLLPLAIQSPWLLPKLKLPFKRRLQMVQVSWFDLRVICLFFRLIVSIGVIQLDPWLEPFRDALKQRFQYVESWVKTINETEGGLDKFSRVSDLSCCYCCSR